MIWKAMNQRCANPNNKAFGRYGGRGITVCERWRVSYENFLADMGRRPSVDHSIERIDNDAGYSLENCVWATKIEQGLNTSRTKPVSVNGKRMSMNQAAAMCGLSGPTLTRRLQAGCGIEEALSAPKWMISASSGKRKDRAMTVDKVRAIRAMAASGITTTAIARALGLPEPTCRAVVHRKSWKHIPDESTPPDQAGEPKRRR